MLEQLAAQFAEHKYVFVPGFIARDICDIATTYTLFKRNFEKRVEVGVQQVPETHSVYGDHLMESLMLFALPWVEKIAQLTLHPTYAHYRVYKPGDELKQHTDRPACQISVSLCLGNYYVDAAPDYGWGLWVRDKYGAHKEYRMNVGDAVIYRGLEVPHWRNRFDARPGSFQSQVFLHYVDAKGQHSDWKFDKRPSLGARAG